MKRLFLPLAIAPVAVVAAGTFGLTRELGAHPQWAAQITVIGAIAGTILSLVILVFARRRVMASLGLFVLCGAALLTANLGKGRFVASYAEDGFAGNLWFFGWIGAATLATSAIGVMLMGLRRR